MLKKIMPAAAAIAALATSASAATLDYVDTDATTFAITAAAPHATAVLNNGDTVSAITGDKKTAANGLELVGGDAFVTYTFIGREAANTNLFLSVGTEIFNTSLFPPKPLPHTVKASAGFLDFSFATSAPAQFIANADNDGIATAPSASVADLAIGYIKISDTSFYVLFDDIRDGDRDFDDIVVRIDIAPVPLPAGGLLLLSGLAGAAALRARKKA